MKITAYNERHHLDLSGSTATTSYTYAQSGTALGSNTPLIESGAGTPGSGPQASAWDHVHPAAAAGAASFGSNSTRVSKNASAGSHPSNSRADHIHDGIGTITSSSSNTMGRGTINFRAGAGAALTATDTDGDGLLDTVTFHSTGTAAAGVSSIAKSGSSALTGAVTLTGGSNVTLTQVGNDISIAASSSGSSIPEQDLAYPTSASGDDDLMASTAGWSDVGSNAWDTFSSDGRILTLIIKGASKSATLRKTLGTTKAAAFDFRMGILPNIDWWSGTGDVLLHVRFRTSGGSTVAAMRFSPQNVQTRYLALGGAGSGVYTESSSIAIPHGLSTVIRCTRDGSNNVLFYYGLGSTPFALLPVVQPGSGTYHAPLTFSSSGTIARVEIEVTTPAGPNAASEWGCKVDYFQSV